MLNVTAETFAGDVERASHGRPVVVDFWGPLCRPCLALTPVLERLEQEYTGRLKLVKVNIQETENKELVQRLRIRGIPLLIAFSGGERVRQLAGNVPETELRAFFDGVLGAPREAETLHLQGLHKIKAGDSAGGLALLREAIALEPRNDEARLALIDALERVSGPPEASRLVEIESLLGACSGATRSDFRYELVQLRWRRMQELSSLPSASDLRERIGADLANLSSRMLLVRRCIGEGALEEAADLLLECVRATAKEARTFNQTVLELRRVFGLYGAGLNAQREQLEMLENQVFTRAESDS